MQLVQRHGVFSGRGIRRHHFLRHGRSAQPRDRPRHIDQRSQSPFVVDRHEGRLQAPGDRPQGLSGIVVLEQEQEQELEAES
jgi:hypothetical protein